MLTLIHGCASSIENAFVKKPGPLQASLTGIPQKITEVYSKEKISALAEAAMAEADIDKDGRISWSEWRAWYPSGISTALGSMDHVLHMV